MAKLIRCALLYFLAFTGCTGDDATDCPEGQVCPNVRHAAPGRQLLQRKAESARTSASLVSEANSSWKDEQAESRDIAAGLAMLQKALWPQFGDQKRKCENGKNRGLVQSQSICQGLAVTYGHAFYNYRDKGDGTAACETAQTCNAPYAVSMKWTMYAQPTATATGPSSWLEPGGACAGADEVEIKVDGTWVSNNFDGQGPYTNHAAEIRLRPAGKLANGKEFDLVLTKRPGTTYKGQPANNGDWAPLFANINQQAKDGNIVGVDISFRDSSSNALVTVPDFYFSFYDIDHGITDNRGTPYESIIIGKGTYESFFLYPGSELDVINYNNEGNFLQIKATRYGAQCDNPTNPNSLTTVNCWGEVVDQRKRAVTF